MQTRESGRPEQLLSAGRVGADRVEHEYELTAFLLPFLKTGRFTVLRGKSVDPHLRPDATLVGTSTTHVELDRGTEALRFVREARMPLYGPRRCVWVAPSEARRANLMRQAGPHQDFYFAVGTGDEWLHASGRAVSRDAILAAGESAGGDRGGEQPG